MEPFSSLSILLLEDEYLIALDAADILKSLGVKQIQTVNTLPAAADIAATGGVDLAILDLNINGELSLGVAELLRKNGVPIVFASGYELRERISAELENGDVYLRKPYTSDSLKEAMHTALGQASARVIPQEAGHDVPARR
jgi:CheY-like chemotaxis protein